MSKILLGIVLITSLFLVGYLFLPKSNPPTSISPNSTLPPNQQTPVVTSTVGAFSYQIFTPQSFSSNSASIRILFFHASWCPTCKVANTDLETNSSQLPEGVVVFKVDYDSETELKKKYGITYQHTFVQVDADGNQLAKWNGGGVAEIVSRVKP